MIEEIGKYHPKEDPSYIDVVSDRAQYWLGVGAQPSDAVAKILKITGDWQKHKGISGTEGTLKVAEAKRDKLEIFNEALKEPQGESTSEAVTKKAAARRPRPRRPPRPRRLPLRRLRPRLEPESRLGSRTPAPCPRSRRPRAPRSTPRRPRPPSRRDRAGQGRRADG